MNKIPLVVFGVLAILLVSGCITGETPGKSTCNPPYIAYGTDCCLDQNSNDICDNDEGQAQESLKSACPYECCKGVNYKTKSCSGGTICENNRCVKPDCPYECCKGQYYKTKDCDYNEECVNNQCVIAQCPYECCTGRTYQTKTCSGGFVCVNNKCEEIKVPKISLSIDACHESLDIFHGLGEVLDVYMTLENYGTKEARNIQVTSTSSDVDKILGSSRATIGSLGPNKYVKFKLTLDTRSGQQSYVTVNVDCDECQPISTSSGDCTFDWEFWADKLTEYGTQWVGAVVPG